MSEDIILSQINKLPDNLKQEVLDYIEYLQKKYLTASEKPAKNRIFGSAKGKYVLASDFDAPLADFDDYM